MLNINQNVIDEIMPTVKEGHVHGFVYRLDGVDILHQGKYFKSKGAAGKYVHDFFEQLINDAAPYERWVKNSFVNKNDEHQYENAKERNGDNTFEWVRSYLRMSGYDFDVDYWDNREQARDHGKVLVRELMKQGSLILKELN